MSALPWGWLNAAPELVTPAEVQRDAALVAETVAFHAIVAHWDDVVPCNVPGVCPNEARWMYRCSQGHEYARCDTDRADFDKRMHETIDAGDIPVCGRCGRAELISRLPSPIPWLPL